MKQIIKKLAIVLSVALVCAPMGAMAANKLIVRDATGVIDKMVVDDRGFIGSGTSAPVSAINIVGTTSAASQIVNQFSGTNASGGGGFIGYHNNAAGALPAANDRLGYFYFGALNGASPLNSAGLSAKAEAAWVASPLSIPSYFAIETTATNTRTEKMRITGAGNVGIGTGTPTQKLQVVGGIKLDNATKPACVLAVRGTIWYTYLGTGSADTLEVCSKDISGNYAWRALF